MLAQPTIELAAPSSDEERLDALIRADYERCHPDDTFDDLKRQGRFSKEDKHLLREWRAVAKRLDRAKQDETASGPLAAAA